MQPPITEHVAKSGRHATFDLACGPVEGEPLIFLHGWPELSVSWRQPIEVNAALAPWLARLPLDDG